MGRHIIVNAQMSSASRAIRKVVHAAGDEGRQQTINIEREEPHTSTPSRAHICAHVDLRERADERQRCQARQAEPFHAERHQPDPRAAVEFINEDTWRKDTLHLAHVISPVQEDNVCPPLHHHRVLDGVGVLWWQRQVVSINRHGSARRAARSPAFHAMTIRQFRIVLVRTKGCAAHGSTSRPRPTR